MTTGPRWRNTVFIINYDEWSGILRARGSASRSRHHPGAGGWLHRWSAQLPRAVYCRFTLDPERLVSHTVFDPTSILKLIGWRFGLQPLSVRDAQANNQASLMDFENPRSTAP